MPPEPPIGFGLMCKPPRPGTSKTRLAAGVGDAVAAELSAAFLKDCAAAVGEARKRTALDCRAYYRPADAAGELAAILGADWPMQFADAGDLGATMRMVLADLLARCPAGAMIMGADVPLIDPHVIDQAARTLREGTDASLVVAPSIDGGYCLIGIKSIETAAPLFERMPWSTSQVLEETLSRARTAGLNVTTLETQRDIDEADDLTWLRTVLASSPRRARATRQVLATMI